MEFRELNCKCCLAPLDINEAVGRTIRCKHCGTVFMLAREDEGKVVGLLRSAELLLDTCKFDEAYTAYQKAAALDEKEPEAYFGMALAAFKVQYLKDEVNNRLQPICHEISEKVFSDDKNFRKALELATDEQRREYRKRGREIDEVREEFFDLQKRGLDYDCFLCVKVTEEDGRTRTADYDRANDIYYYLKDEGYKPFFSEREMKGRTGSDYEALILYALYKSECMLIVCSNEEYLQTKWVKNEYTRFLHMLANEEKERDAISFAFHGKPVEKLPNGKKVQGIDLAKPDAYSRIGNFVEAHTPAAKKKREEEAAKKQQEEEARKRELEDMRAMFEELKRGTSAPQQPVQGGRPSEEANRERTEERTEAERRGRDEGRTCPAQFDIQDGVLKKYNGEGGYAAIPEGVTEIGERAFYDCKTLYGVEIPQSVTTIGNYAFSGCSGLTDLVLPKNLTAIGDHAFAFCSGLTGKCRIPNGVTTIGDHAFAFCSGLTGKCRIPNSVTAIGRHAFNSCSGVKGKVRIPSGVTVIEQSVFWNCKGISGIVIPNGVTLIRGWAFADCDSLTGIEIPRSVKTIEDYAFCDCKELKKVVLPIWFKGGADGSALMRIFGGQTAKIKFDFIK